MAGLNRLGMSDIVSSAIAPEDMLPAVAQGAIGIEGRCDDERAAEMLAAIHNTSSGQRLGAERAFLAALDGSCETPIAALAVLEGIRFGCGAKFCSPMVPCISTVRSAETLQMAPEWVLILRKNCWDWPQLYFLNGVPRQMAKARRV